MTIVVQSLTVTPSWTAQDSVIRPAGADHVRVRLESDESVELQLQQLENDGWMSRCRGRSQHGAFRAPRASKATYMRAVVRSDKSTSATVRWEFD